MKYFLGLFVMLCLGLNSYAQKIVVLHKAFKEPIIIADSLTTPQQESNNYFTVEPACIDTFYAALKYIKTFLQTKQDTTVKTLKFKSLSTSITINGILYFAFGKRYNIMAKTTVDYVTTSLQLSSKDIANRKSINYLDKLMLYISSTKGLLKPTENIRPNFYVEVVTIPIIKK